MADMDIDWQTQYRQLEVQMETMLLAIAKKMDHLEEVAERFSDKINDVEYEYTDGMIRCVAIAYINDPEYGWRIRLPEGDNEIISWSRCNVLSYEPGVSGKYEIDALVRSAQNEETLLTRSLEPINVSLIRSAQ